MTVKTVIRCTDILKRIIFYTQPISLLSVYELPESLTFLTLWISTFFSVSVTYINSHGECVAQVINLLTENGIIIPQLSVFLLSEYALSINGSRVSEVD